MNGYPPPVGSNACSSVCASTSSVEALNRECFCRDKNDNLLAIDQRDAPRPVGARCDIGAFEFGSLPLPNLLFANGFE